MALGVSAVLIVTDSMSAISPLTVTLLITVMVLGGTIMYLSVQRIVRTRVVEPLQRIQEATRAIVQGAQQSEIDVPALATSEIADVATAINTLAEKATRDIAEMKRLERVRSEFVGNVSHELRTPIFSVQGYLETLIDGALDDPSVSRQFLEKAYQNALRLNALLSDLIDISRIESGELRMSFRYFDMADLLHDLVHTMEIRGTQRNVSVVLDVPAGTTLTVFGDKERLIQVMTNLIDNAIKYNRDGGTVTVHGSALNDRVRISVEDTGVGIPADSINRIFERFYRVDKDRSRAVGGTGLGLAIVKHILEAHNATLTVESQPNIGTKISFELKGMKGE
jgi:two-component system phosphate regulon sensor histidine kinase PhoR